MRAALLCLALLCGAPVSSGQIALRADLAVDGRGERHAPATVLIRDGKIVSFGAEPPTDGVEVVDLRGYTLLPGLIDAHVHITYHFDDGGARSSSNALWGAFSARRLLESGFTTVRSLGSSDYADVDLRDAIESGLVPGPRILASGRPLSDGELPGTEGDRVKEGARAANEAAIRAAVRERVAEGVDWIKIFATRSSRAGGTPTHSLEQLRWAVDEAERAGVPVSVHAHAAEGARRAILAGARTIEHGSLLDEETLDLMKERGVFYSPNLYLSEYYLAHAEDFGFSPEALEWTRKLLEPRTEIFGQAAAKGVPIIFATDANSGWVWSGETAIELERRVAAGQSTRDAVVSATSRAAEALNLSDVVGDLAPGLEADIIAVDGDPLEDVSALGRVVFVMKSGKTVRKPDALERGSFTEDIEGRTIHYEVHGEGPVLMTVPNSWGLTLEGLREMYRPLEEHLTLVYFDPRGMGGSGPAVTAVDRGPSAVREDFHALRRHLGLERVAAIGWSNGATNLVYAASEEPDAIEAAIFLHGNASFTEEDQARMLERYPDLFREFARFGREMTESGLTAEERNARVKEFDVGVWFPYMFRDRAMAADKLPVVFRDAEFSWEHFRATNEEWGMLDATDRLGDIRARALVIAGRHDMMPPERAKEIADGIPGPSEFVVLEESGHFAPLEEPAKFVATVLDFLDVSTE